MSESAKKEMGIRVVLVSICESMQHMGVSGGHILSDLQDADLDTIALAHLGPRLELWLESVACVLGETETQVRIARDEIAGLNRKSTEDEKC